jgi:BMFP domain-containing protein YqiC
MAMSPVDQLAKLAQQVLDTLPEGKAEVKRHLHAALLNGLQNLDLVTREEFEVQSRLLERSREKLEKLEAQLAELERHAPK